MNIIDDIDSCAFQLSETIKMFKTIKIDSLNSLIKLHLNESYKHLQLSIQKLNHIKDIEAGNSENSENSTTV